MRHYCCGGIAVKVKGTEKYTCSMCGATVDAAMIEFGENEKP